MDTDEGENNDSVYERRFMGEKRANVQAKAMLQEPSERERERETLDKREGEDHSKNESAEEAADPMSSRGRRLRLRSIPVGFATEDA